MLRKARQKSGLFYFFIFEKKIFIYEFLTKQVPSSRINNKEDIYF